MKERVSELMDGALDERAADELIGRLPRDGEAAEAWRTYHLIGDVMRGTAPRSEGFAARVSWKLADEPTVLAPQRGQAETRPAPRHRLTLTALAASLAAVALVGWMAFAPQPQVAPAPLAQVNPAPEAKAEPAPTLVPLPTAANDYLLAHQGFSPRASLVPYVRTVSEQVTEPRK
jgi:sigma-E factor negative regulatory protein RseA